MTEILIHRGYPLIWKMEARIFLFAYHRMIDLLSLYASRALSFTSINRAAISFMNRDYHNAFYLLLTTVVACCLLYKLRAAAYKKPLPLLTFTANGNDGLFITFYPRGRNQKKRERIWKYRCVRLKWDICAVRDGVPMNLVFLDITWCAPCNLIPGYYLLVNFAYGGSRHVRTRPSGISIFLSGIFRFLTA